MNNPVTRLDYCQYLLVSQINYTLTNFAEHSEKFSHDQINRYLRGEKITPRLIWENVRNQVVQSENGYVIFDDTVVDKNYSYAIELVRRQYSGNAHGLIKGIGVVTCIYVNPELDDFWVIDYRIYDPVGDGKSKLDHLQEMFSHTVYQKKVALKAVLMDTWYTKKEVMLLIESLEKLYYCQVKDNRLVDDSGGKSAYQRMESLSRTAEELQEGKILKIKGFAKEHKVHCFRVVVSTNRTYFIVTNNQSQNSTKAIQDAYSFRWRIEQLHRESKQLTGLENSQCRS